VNRTNNEPLRVVFAAEVFVFANTFEGEIIDTSSENLPQKIEPGDAAAAVATNSLKVWGASTSKYRFIEDLHLSSSVLTPNGDGANDRLGVEYSLFRLPTAVPVELAILRLDGTRATRIEGGNQSAGRQQIFWDGRDENGRLLSPGIYLVDLIIHSETGTIHRARPLGIAY
jgi:hypothetical protein